MSGVIKCECHSGSHRGSSCGSCQYGPNTACNRCKHPKHGKFAKPGIPCLLYRYVAQIAVERKHGKNGKTRVYTLCNLELPLGEFRKGKSTCRKCTRELNAASAERHRAKEHALLEAGREKLGERIERIDNE